MINQFFRAKYLWGITLALTIIGINVAMACSKGDPANEDENTTPPPPPESGVTSDVYMTKNISSEGLMAIYKALGRTPKNGDKVAVKISTGEGANSYHLRPAFIEALVKEVNGDIVEANTAYGGSRASTARHYQVAADRGYTAIATVVIMDESGTTDIPIPNGKHLSVNRVGAHFDNYQFHVVLSHFKGHAMAGYGGALKNMSIGYALAC